MRKRIVLKLMLICGVAFFLTANHAAPPISKSEMPRKPEECSFQDPQKQDSFCYVAVPSVLLREQASVEHAAHAKFPIGTKVRVLEKDGDWLKVYAYGRKNDEQGWLYSKYLQKLAPSLESITLQFKALPVTKKVERRQLAEQAIALTPFSAQAHQMLLDVYKAAGDFVGLKQAQDQYDELISDDVKKRSGEQTLIFAVDNGMLSPFAALGENGLVPVEQQINDALPNAEQKESVYFRQGRGVNFYQRGAFAGKLRVSPIEKISCQLDIAGALDINGNALDDRVIGLASNQALVQPKGNQALPMNAKQAEIMDTLLRKGLKTKGVNKQTIAQLLQLIRSDNQDNNVQGFAISSGKENHEWLLTSYEAEIKEDNKMYYGFLIAEKTSATSYRMMHFDHQQTTTVENYGSLRFLDYLDLDQDGMNELIFIGYGFESWRYEAWSLKDKKWKRAAFGGGGGC
jgi:hypothetical protein